MRLQRGALTAVLAASAAGCGANSDDAAPLGETWCGVVAASNTLDDEFDSVDAQDRAALATVVDKIGELGRRFRAAAPAPIGSQVETYADVNDQLVEVFAAADYDVAELDNDAREEAISNLDGVAEQIDVFTVAECGVPLGSDDT